MFDTQQGQQANKIRCNSNLIICIIGFSSQYRNGRDQISNRKCVLIYEREITVTVCRASIFIFDLNFRDVTLSGFCLNYCGWHNYGTISGAAYKFAFVGMPTCSQCLPQSSSPNDDAPLDAAINHIAHELAGAATDPTGFGWCYSGSGSNCFGLNAVENVDQCAWYFPEAVKVGSYSYNLQIGSLKYYIQANWNPSKKACLMA